MTTVSNTPYSYLGSLQSLYGSYTPTETVDNSVTVPALAVEDTVDFSAAANLVGSSVSQLITGTTTPSTSNQLLGGLIGGGDSSYEDPFINVLIASAEAKITQDNIDLYNELATGVSSELSGVQSLVASLGAPVDYTASTGQIFDLIV
jgi:hypothetical protein